MKSVAAFANGEGGTILFGVSNDGELDGLAAEEELSNALDTISGLVSSWVHPLPRYEVEWLPVPREPGRRIIALVVE